METTLMPKHTNDELHYMLQNSMHNKKFVVANAECGCYFCLRTFKSSEIVDWIDADEDTALCPHCDIDAILPGVTDLETLTQMNIYAFTVHEDER